MSNFDQAIGVILAHEGGWVNNPSDPGGETSMGWSTPTIKTLGLTAEDLGVPGPLFVPGYLKTMPQEAAVRLYKKYFWDKYGYEHIKDAKVATKIFDTSVNCGPQRAARIAQRSANSLGMMLKEDGSLGDFSFEAINKCEPSAFLEQFRKELADYYLSLIAANPKLAVFKSNWLKRADS